MLRMKSACAVEWMGTSQNRLKQSDFIKKSRNFLLLRQTGVHRSHWLLVDCMGKRETTAHSSTGTSHVG